MTTEIANMAPNQVWAGMAKLVLVMTAGLLIVGWGVTAAASDPGGISPIILNALMISIALSVLTSGFRTVLSIIDWFKARGKRAND